MHRYLGYTYADVIAVRSAMAKLSAQRMTRLRDGSADIIMQYPNVPPAQVPAKAAEAFMEFMIPFIFLPADRAIISSSEVAESANLSSETASTVLNWLRYGVQPRNARDGLRPGSCRGKAHRAEHLGYAGRRVLVSRKWSGKTLGDHRADRRDWVLNLLGNTTEPADPNRYAWKPVRTGDPDVRSLDRRLLLAIAQRTAWRHALDEAKRRAGVDPPDRSATTVHVA